ncbi:MAG: dipeptidase [Lachnospiraceae bacterium]
MKMENESLKLAVKLHRENPVVDAHLDLPGEILYRHCNGEKHIIKNYYMDNWKRAGINLIIASVFVETRLLPEMGLVNAMKQIQALKSEIKENDEIVLVKSRKDLEKVIEENMTGIILYAEGLDFLGYDKNLLELFFELGLRGAALTWSRNNLLATGCATVSQNQNKYGGLTAYGRKMVSYMENLGMFLDVSHMNDDGFKEICIIAKKPFLATHSGSREICNNYRNLSDWQLEKIARLGGVVGMNGYRHLIGAGEGENPIVKMCEHIEHMVKIMGYEHVGYGFDFCDSYDNAKYLRNGTDSPDDCLGNHSGIPLLTATLLLRGMDSNKAIGIMGGNFINYLKRNLPKD